jgi:hypothetical protein
MDFEMKWLKMNNKKGIIDNMGYSRASTRYWIKSIEMIKNKKVDTWDWQWYFSLATQNQLCIFSKANLVANIGFGKNATHTFGKPKNSFIKVCEIKFPLVHPRHILADNEHDKIFEKSKIKYLFARNIISNIKTMLYELLY